MAVAIAFREWRLDGGANFLTWIRRPVYYAMLKLARENSRRGGNLRGAPRVNGKKVPAVLVSLDSDNDFFSGEGEVVKSFHDVLGDFEEPADPFVKSRLPALVSQLDKRERQVLRLRFERGLAYTEVGARLKISRERVRQLEQKALERLKQMMAAGAEEAS